jgi:hypothetical protein
MGTTPDDPILAHPPRPRSPSARPARAPAATKRAGPAAAKSRAGGPSRPAAVHPGRILQCFDHFVIDLRAPDGTAAYFTVYAVEYAPELGTGHVAFLRTHEAEGRELDLTLTDSPEMAARMQERLRHLTATRDVSRGIGTSLEQEAVLATFQRHPWTAERVGWTIRAASGTVIEAFWLQPEEPIWTAAMAGTFTPERDILGMLAGFAGAELRISNDLVPGAPWPDPWWTARLGRPFSSTHVALAEASLTPAGSWWDGLRG